MIAIAVGIVLVGAGLAVMIGLSDYSCVICR